LEADHPENGVLIPRRNTAYNNTRDPNSAETYAYISRIFQQFAVAYVHICDINATAGQADLPKILEMVRPNCHGPNTANAGITPEAAAELVGSGKVDAVAFGRLFIANPDLPIRIRANGPFNELRYVGFYGGNEAGYTDYPLSKQPWQRSFARFFDALMRY
jgi:N-ethylmaleimide reductase